MSTPRRIHGIVLLLLPVVVAGFGLSVPAAAALVAVVLLWRWALALSGLGASGKGAPPILDTMPASHFVEKVRWCMDRLGIDYTENQTVGVLGIVFTGRTVPRLRLRTGVVESSIGNSPEILRFLWGAHSAADDGRAKFLEPTAERLALEQQLDRYGVNLQVWLYWHLRDARDLTLRAWGAESSGPPAWQRRLSRIIYPVLQRFVNKAFRVDESHYRKAMQRIEELLGEIDLRLADGRQSILAGQINYTDLAFAALTGLWLQPPGYGGGKADACLLERRLLPEPMRSDIERWIEDHPKSVQFVERLYRDERGRGTIGEAAGPRT